MPWAVGPAGMRNELLGWGGKKGKRGLLRREHSLIAAVLPPEVSPPDRVLSRYVGSGPRGVRACRWKEVQKATLGKGISHREEAVVASTPTHRGWPPIGMGSHGGLCRWDWLRGGKESMSKPSIRGHLDDFGDKLCSPPSSIPPPYPPSPFPPPVTPPPRPTE